MGAPKGNQFWKVRSSHGRDKIFATPEILWDAACEYFEWVEENPLLEYKCAQFQGTPVPMEIPKMRAMTLAGLCMFLGVNHTYLNHFESGLDMDTQQGKGFSKVIEDIRQVIYQQKFAGAAADLLNSNIIARDLGLADKQDMTHSGRIDSNQTVKQISAEMDSQEATRLYQDMINGSS